MRIFVNGEARDIAATASMSDLIEQLELGDQRIAVEVNQTLVPRSTFQAHRLTSDDQVEIIHAVGGG